MPDLGRQIVYPIFTTIRPQSRRRSWSPSLLARQADSSSETVRRIRRATLLGKSNAAGKSTGHDRTVIPRGRERTGKRGRAGRIDAPAQRSFSSGFLRDVALDDVARGKLSRLLGLCRAAARTVT